MKNPRIATLFCFCLILPFLSVPLHAAPQKKSTSPAPIPAQILSAQRVFIANLGGDESGYEEATYTGSPDRLYNEFYAAMKSWGRFELVSTPTDADLVFEIQLTIFQLQHVRILSDDAPEFDSQFHLTIRDPKSHQTLWGLTEHAAGAVMQDNRDKNFEQALSALIAELHRITAPPPPNPAKN